MAISLCHNVTPVYPNEHDKSIKELQASSPDEVALVKFGDSLGMVLLEREDQKIVIQNPNGQIEEYEILANFPFSSETKRMGIILRHVDSSKIIFYLKGADSVMVDKIKPQQRDALNEQCESLAMEGLRTLVFGQRLLGQTEYE